MGEINRQLEDKGIILMQGGINIVVATPFEVAESGSGKGMGHQPEHDMQAGWHVKKDRCRKLKSTYSYFVDTSADANNFIQCQTVRAVSVHDRVEAICSRWK